MKLILPRFLLFSLLKDDDISLQVLGLEQQTTVESLERQKVYEKNKSLYL